MITKLYECQVPIRCNTSDPDFACHQSVNGTWTDADGQFTALFAFKIELNMKKNQKKNDLLQSTEDG